MTVLAFIYAIERPAGARGGVRLQSGAISTLNGNIAGISIPSISSTTSKHMHLVDRTG
jgi:hypothetical protein